MGDLDMVLKDSKEDREMQRMAEEEQQELQQQARRRHPFFCTLCPACMADDNGRDHNIECMPD